MVCYRVLKSHPSLDCAFLNSGIQRSIDFAQPESIDLELVSTEFTTNYLSYIHLSKALLSHLQAQGKRGEPAGLIFTTSGLALVPITRCGNYCASKAAMHHLILVMREQLRGDEKSGDKGVKVIEIYPPAVQTELHDEKHQPDIKNGHSFGMPLDEFTEETWAGLVKGDDDIPVGMTRTVFGFDGVEMSRKKLFEEMIVKIKQTEGQ